MDTQTLKEKLTSGKITEEEVTALLNGISKARGSGFMAVVQQLIETYLAPRMWKQILEAALIFAAILAICILSYTGRIDATVTAVLMGFSLGFLFGRLR